MECHVYSGNPKQRALRSARTKKDWNEITAPVNHSAIVADCMGEQFPGRSREAVRAFRHSEALVATVPDLHVSTVQATIAALGLATEMYAEQRGNETVLRRIEPNGTRRLRRAASA